MREITVRGSLMPAATWDIYLEEESEFNLDIFWLQEDGSDQNISGYGAIFEVRKERDTSSTSLIRGGHTTDIVTVDDANSKFIIEALEGDVSSINVNHPDFKVGAWDLLIFPDPANPSKDAKRLVQGEAYYIEAAATLP